MLELMMRAFHANTFPAIPAKALDDEAAVGEHIDSPCGGLGDPMAAAGASIVMVQSLSELRKKEARFPGPKQTAAIISPFSIDSAILHNRQ